MHKADLSNLHFSDIYPSSVVAELRPGLYVTCAIIAIFVPCCSGRLVGVDVVSLQWLFFKRSN